MITTTTFKNIYPFTMLFIILPIPLILISILLYISTFSVCHTISPLSFVNISISLDQPAFTISLSLRPWSIVNWVILPNLLSIAMLNTPLSLSTIPNSFFDGEQLKWIDIGKNLRLIEIRTSKYSNIFSILCIKILRFDMTIKMNLINS